jgi:hypothetical protein
MKEKIAEIYAQALIDDLAPNVFADQVLRLLIVSGSLLTEFCKCDEPDREAGFTYCHKCHRHVSNERMDELTKDDD